MPRFTIKRFETIFAQMIAKLVSRTDLSDVADSSAVKHILAAAARQDDEQYYQMALLKQLFSIKDATGDDLDERAKDIQPGTISRITARASTGAVVFSRAGTAGSVTVPAQTKVKTAEGIIFTTSAEATITPASPEQIPGHGAGRDSAPVTVVSDEKALKCNVDADTITSFVAKPAGVDEVTNPLSTSYGQDRERDDAFRARLQTYVAGLARSTVSAIESGLAGQQDPSTNKTIIFVNVVEDQINRGNITVYIDDGTGAAESSAAVVGEVLTRGLAGPPADTAVGGEEYLYADNWPIKISVVPSLTSNIRGALTYNTHYKVNPANSQFYFTPALVTGESITAGYTRYTGLIAYAQKLVDGDPNDRLNYPGLRAGGIRATVNVPQVLVQTITVAVTVLDGYNQTSVKTEVKEAIKLYINSLGISGDVIRNELIRRIMGVSGVYNIVLTDPANDVAILDDQLARTTDLNITVT